MCLVVYLQTAKCSSRCYCSENFDSYNCTNYLPVQELSESKSTDIEIYRQPESYRNDIKIEWRLTSLNKTMGALQSFNEALTRNTQEFGSSNASSNITLPTDMYVIINVCL